MAVTRTITTRVRLTGDAEYKTKMQGINRELKNFGSWMGVFKGNLAMKGLELAGKGLREAAEIMVKAVKGAVDFEKALTGVGKTTTMNAVELEHFGEQLKDMSERLPMTAAELAGMAEIAGQLGIADKDLLSFTETIAAMGVSTNLTGEEAATTFARIANVMHTASSDYERLGSVVVDLGNNFATTESEITDMAQRLTASGFLVGMSESDVLAFGAALSSVGIQAEAGGSSISKFFASINSAVMGGKDDLTAYAEAAKMTREEFSETWYNDPAMAVLAFSEGLHAAWEEGENLDSILNNLDLKDIRMKRALESMAANSDVLANSLSRSRTAWQENTALTEEAGRFYGTTASKIDMLKNSWNNLLSTVGEIAMPVLTGAVEAGGEMIQSLRDAVENSTDLEDTMNGIAEDYDATNESISGTMASMDAWIGRLEELGNYEKINEAEQLEWLSTLNLIKTAMPGVAGSFDTVTGEIYGGTEALRESAKAAEEEARAIADMTKVSNEISALEIAKEDLANKQALLTEYTAQYTYQMGKLEEVKRRFVELGGILPADGDLTAWDITNMSGISTDVMHDMVDDLNEAYDNIDKYSGKMRELSEQIPEDERLIAEYALTVAKAADTAGETIGAVTERYSAAEQEMIDRTQVLSDMIDEVKVAWEEAYTAAAEAIDQVVKGYDAIEMPELGEGEGLGDLTENLQSQIDYLTKYDEMLNRLRERGVDNETLQELATPTEENFKTVAALAEGTDEQLDAFMAKQAEVQAAKDALAGTMADITVDLDTTAEAVDTVLTQMVEEANKYPDTYASAMETVQGLIDGIGDKFPELQTKVDQLKELMNGIGGGSGGGSDKGTLIPKHADGLDYVPYDGYIAELHRGEMILTAAAARAYRADQQNSYQMLQALAQRQNSGGGVNVSGNNFYIRDQNDIRELAIELSNYSRAAQVGRGERYA